MATTTAPLSAKTTLAEYFAPYRARTIGIGRTFVTPYGEQPLVYADWTASGRLYAPIEDRLTYDIAPFVGNTHTETTVTGSSMTIAYHKALKLIKRHVNAAATDVIISSNSGMTGVINKFQRLLGYKIHERLQPFTKLPDHMRPIVFVTHMEHHSNQTSWLETICDVEVIKACPRGLVCLEDFARLLHEYRDRRTKIAAITSCSNVTGIKTPYHQMAGMIHRAGGLCFVDFACSAPYIDINMHPGDPDERLDAIYFSPHKFLGGPGGTGILIFDSRLYKNRVPDHPGGGTVDWTNPWGQHKYVEDIEAREDGGTPAFLQTIRVALAVQLKERMGVDRMLAREEELLRVVWDRMDRIDNLHILAGQHRDRLGVISFYIEDCHYNLAVKLLNDRFGVQTRGGCSCAGTYGHYLLQVDQELSHEMTARIGVGDVSVKPGWVRMSIHPIMSDSEVAYIMDAIEQVAAHHSTWRADYRYVPSLNEYVHHADEGIEHRMVADWFGPES